MSNNMERKEKDFSEIQSDFIHTLTSYLPEGYI